VRTAVLRESTERRRPSARRHAKRSPVVALDDSAGQLTVATYNVHSCVGIDRRYDPPRVAAVLRELGADIIGLQEVDGRRLDQGAYLSEETGLTIVPGLSLTDHRSRFGNAILTRLPVRAVRYVDLSVKGYEPRSAIDVDLDAGGRALRVVATHFGLRGHERREQTERLLATLANGRGNGVGSNGASVEALLMMGDLNEWRGRRGGIPRLDRELGRTPAPRTFPSWCPVLPLDRIYAAAPAALLHFDVHRSLLSRLASDHLPLRARLGWHRASG
jgi:endonuclease/exonuclease/phosphatase family metal-dependent hydrolase